MINAKTDFKWILETFGYGLRIAILIGGAVALLSLIDIFDYALGIVVGTGVMFFTGFLCRIALDKEPFGRES